VQKTSVEADMVAQVKPTTKNSPAVKVGRNPNNKPAESYEKNGTGAGAMKKATGHGEKDPNTMNADESVPGGMSARRVSVGNITRGPKTDGIKIRGTGAATKGVMARGPMA
jgi:hypothetical protein